VNRLDSGIIRFSCEIFNRFNVNEFERWLFCFQEINLFIGFST
jgi:hypothetical protein